MCSLAGVTWEATEDFVQPMQLITSKMIRHYKVATSDTEDDQPAEEAQLSPPASPCAPAFPHSSSSQESRLDRLERQVANIDAHVCLLARMMRDIGTHVEVDMQNYLMPMPLPHTDPVQEGDDP